VTRVAAFVAITVAGPRRIFTGFPGALKHKNSATNILAENDCQVLHIPLHIPSRSHPMANDCLDIFKGASRPDHHVDGAKSDIPSKFFLDAR
jgi:hypothetical protein